MTLTRPSPERVLPVRLDRIRPDVRYRAAQQVAERDPADGAECLHAALFPSSTTYWVALDAWPILRRVAASGAESPRGAASRAVHSSDTAQTVGAAAVSLSAPGAALLPGDGRHP